MMVGPLYSHEEKRGKGIFATLMLALPQKKKKGGGRGC